MSPNGTQSSSTDSERDNIYGHALQTNSKALFTYVTSDLTEAKELCDKACVKPGVHAKDLSRS